MSEGLVHRRGLVDQDESSTRTSRSPESAFSAKFYPEPISELTLGELFTGTDLLVLFLPATGSAARLRPMDNRRTTTFSP